MSLGSDIVYDFDPGTLLFTVGGGRVVDSIPASNGVIMLISTVLLPDDHPTAPAATCGAAVCTDHSTCRALPSALGSPRFSDYSQSTCSCGGAIPSTDYVCGTDQRSYRNLCHLACTAAQTGETVALAYDSACLEPACVCDDGYYRPDGAPGSICVVAPDTTTQAAWTMPSGLPTPPPQIFSHIQFYMNGSYYRVVQGRVMMTDQIFSQQIRENFRNSVGISQRAISELAMEVHPSSRMPGYILVDVAGPDAGILAAITAAITAGQVGTNWAHANWENDRDALGPTYLKAFPMMRSNLPPIVRYGFWVDVDYDEAMCSERTGGSQGVCNNECKDRTLAGRGVITPSRSACA